MGSATRACVLVAALFALSCSSGAMAGKYISERDRTPSDCRELKADGTFGLEEDGTTPTGSCSASAARVDLAVTAGRKISATIAGTDLIDSGEGAGRWSRQ